MPSAFAHAAFGASLSAWLPERVRTWRTSALLAGLAAAPDLDVLGFALGIPYAHPWGHRGISHSLPFAALLAAASLPLWHTLRVDGARVLAWFCFLALGSHGVLDTFTDAGLGIGLLLPFDDARVFAPWRPISTSPLSVAAFFSPVGLSILKNEALWIGVPSLLGFAGALLRRRGRGAMSRYHRE